MPRLMKLSTLRADHYRSIRGQKIQLDDFNLFIGANASGKSTVLDTLRFLSEAVRTHDFKGPVFARGGLLNLAWKGEAAHQIGLTAWLNDEGRKFEWSLRLGRSGHEFQVDQEWVRELGSGAPVQLLDAAGGEGWWWSGEQGQVKLKQAPTACALAAAAADESFPARGVARVHRPVGILRSQSVSPPPRLGRAGFQ